MSKVLCVVASTATLKSGSPTGFWLEELAAPYARFVAAGHDVSIASIPGGSVSPDPASIAAPFLTDDGERFLADSAAMQRLKRTLSITQVRAKDYAAVFLVGGVPAALDFDKNGALNTFLSSMIQQAKPVGAVCHGVIGLTTLADSNGTLLAKGHPMTGFSRQEEELFNLLEVVAVVPEDRLRGIGADYRRAAAAFGPCVAEGPLFVTGQNPASAGPAADALIAKMTAE
jgi:putative intracellular protease/amidase